TRRCVRVVLVGGGSARDAGGRSNEGRARDDREISLQVARDTTPDLDRARMDERRAATLDDLWEQVHPEYQRVEQRDWDVPERTEWVATLDAATRAASTPPILVATRLGCIPI